jgi:hypothetical protein
VLEPLLPLDPVVLPLPPEVPLIPPVLPVVDPVPVLMSVPASRPEARGSVALRRPSGELALVPLAVPAPPERPLLLHAPTEAIIAAADAKVIHLRSVMVVLSCRCPAET